MKKKKIILIFVPVLIVLLVVGLLIGNFFKNKDKEPLDSSNSNQESLTYSYNTVYLADNENTLIPLSIKYQSFDSVGEELMYLITSLKVDSEVSNDTFNGLLPKSCSVKSLQFEEGIVSVNFDNEFKKYDSKNELKILESLVWTLCDYEGVSGVSLYMDDVILKNMPVNNTPINSVLTKEIGINNYLLTSTILGSGQRVLSYYEKQINDSYYYVPVTHYVNNKENINIYDLTVNTLFKDPGITSSLQVCRIFKDTEMVSGSILTNNVLYVSLSEDILYDEVTVSLDVYNILLKVTALLKDVKDVSFLMELEEIKVNGKQENETTEVSKIELNKFYI